MFVISPDRTMLKELEHIALAPESKNQEILSLFSTENNYLWSINDFKRVNGFIPGIEEKNSKITKDTCTSHKTFFSDYIYEYKGEINNSGKHLTLILV